MENSTRSNNKVARRRSWGSVNAGWICLQYCHSCDQENTPVAVTTGRCAWCGAGPSEVFRYKNPASGEEMILEPEVPRVAQAA